MKNLIIILLLCIFSISTSAQKRTTVKSRVKLPTTLVTKAMADKISDFCLYGQGYGKAVFYQSNSKYLTFSDVAQGKGIEIMQSLSKYPKYSENFIYGVYRQWGYDGLKQIGFTDVEIAKSKKIVAKKQAE